MAENAGRLSNKSIPIINKNDSLLINSYNLILEYLEKMKERQEDNKMKRKNAYAYVAAKAWCSIIKEEYSNLMKISNIDLLINELNEKDYQKFSRYINKMVLMHFRTSNEPLYISYNSDNFILYNATLKSGISTILIPDGISMEVRNSTINNKCVLIKRKNIQEPNYIYNS